MDASLAELHRDFVKLGGGMLDFTFLFILLFATLLGFFRGFVKEFFGFCCLLASVFLAFYHYDHEI